MKTTKEKVQEKVKAELGYDIERIRTIHTGRNMKASGALSWVSNIVDSPLEIGSTHPMTEIIKKSNRLELLKGVSSTLEIFII